MSSLELGAFTYGKGQLLAILHTPVKGNGLISLAHQLIAAKLNVALGASSPTITEAIALSDEVIAALVIGTDQLKPRATSALVGALDEFNNSNDDNCTPPPGCGNGVLEAGEACDDGNTASGDGCSSRCGSEPPPPNCGDGRSARSGRGLRRRKPGRR